ncbi:hypothetical protein, partial [Escherichia coli]|uniref:hypothetical protein n=1 Tax=Escherichia coli TaxID=562 RepID=UPI00196403A2
IVKLVTKRRKSNNQIVLNCLHQHNLITIEGRTKLFSAPSAYENSVFDDCFICSLFMQPFCCL